MPSGKHSRPRRERRFIPRRRWPRRILVAVNVVVALCLLAAGGAYGYVRYRIDAIHTQAAPDLTKETGSGGAGSPENILLVGNQTRAGLSPSQAAQFGNPQLLSGSLSDVLMILHLDPTKKTASLLSIPRDLFAPMPAGSPVGKYQKIDAALNDGVNGIDNLIKAVEQDFGIPINHYVELEFNGFMNTVNSLGGINMYFPMPLWDQYSLLNIPTTGCIHLDGAQALALVRARHLQYDPPGDTASRFYWPYDPLSDLSRIVRDHTFLRVLFSTAISKGLGNPITLNSFLGAITNQITIDPGLKNQLINLAVTYRHLSPTSIPETTLPVVVANNYYYDGYSMGDVDLPVQPQDNQTIAAWDSGALPAPVTPTAVNVYNITGAGNLATDTSQALTSLGLPAGQIGNAPVPATPSETLVRYAPGQVAQAEAVFSHLSGPVMLKIDPSVTPGTVTVDAGTGLTVIGGAPTNPSASSSPTAAAPTTSTGASSTAVSSAPTTELGQTPSSAANHLQPWDPRPCPGT